MKIKLNVTLKIGSGQFLPIGSTLEGDIDDFPFGVKRLIEIKSPRIEILPEPKPIVKKVVEPKKVVKKIIKTKKLTKKKV